MRLVGLDIFRGVALLLMIIFHFCFDLNNFHIVDFDLKHGEFWRYFRFIIVTMFVFTAGVSLQLTHRRGISFVKVKKRVLILGSASLLVSIGSYTQFPDSWIYFGILHFFLFASLAGLLFLKLPKISLLVAVAILVVYNLHLFSMHWLFLLLQKPLHLPAFYTEDLASVIPWFAPFLVGIATASYGWHEKIFTDTFFKREHALFRLFAFMGRHSLLIYLIHQPILFGIFLLM